MGVIFVELVISISTGIILKMNSRLLNLSYLSTSIRFYKLKLNLHVNDKKIKKVIWIQRKQFYNDIGLRKDVRSHKLVHKLKKGSQ